MLEKCLSIGITILCFVVYAYAVVAISVARKPLTGMYAKWNAVVCVLCTSAGWLLASKFLSFVCHDRLEMHLSFILLLGCLIMSDVLTKFFNEILTALSNENQDVFAAIARHYVVLPDRSGIRAGSYIYSQNEIALGLHISTTVQTFLLGFLLHCIDLVSTKELLFYVH